MKKIAIYGGTFNPIHLAHVKLADYAVKEFELDELYFMPAYVSPFKQDDKIASTKDRLSMINGILDYNSKFKSSDYEIKKETVSYTIETLDYLSKFFDGKLYFILGIDSLASMDRWYKGKEILSKYPIITAKRPGSDDAETMSKIENFIKDFGAEIHILDMPEMDISSSDIRAKLRAGKSIKGLVLPSTEEYIHEHNLYRD